MPRIIPKSTKLGTGEALVMIAGGVFIAFLAIELLVEYHSKAGQSGGMLGTGFMFRMHKPIIRGWNGVVRPMRGVKTPSIGQDNPDVMPSVTIGGSAPTTPEPVRPFPTFTGY